MSFSVVENAGKVRLLLSQDRESESIRAALLVFQLSLRLHNSHSHMKPPGKFTDLM